MIAIILFWLLMDGIALGIFMYMPLFRREDAFFGVRVSPEYYREEGRRILHRYWFWLVMTFLEIEVIGVLLTVYRQQVFLARIPALLLLISAAVILHIIYYRQVKPFGVVDERQRFASSLRVRRFGDYTNIAFEIFVILLTVGATLTLVYFYPLLPDRIPVHWNLRGEPDGWARKSFATVFFVPFMSLYLQGLFLLFKHGMLQTKMTLPAEKTEEYLEGKEETLNINIRLMDYMRVMIAVLLGAISLNIIFTSFEELRYLMKVINLIVGIAAFLIMGGAFYYIYKLFMVDDKLKSTSGRSYVQSQTDADHWYGGGLFYYNPDDPSLFVEKLVGLGYTLNMGNKRVYIYIAYLLVVPILVGWAVIKL